MGTYVDKYLKSTFPVLPRSVEASNWQGKAPSGQSSNQDPSQGLQLPHPLSLETAVHPVVCLGAGTANGAPLCLLNLCS